MSDYMKEMERLVSDLIDAAHGTVMTEDQEREDTARAALLAHAAQADRDAPVELPEPDGWLCWTCETNHVAFCKYEPKAYPRREQAVRMSRVMQYGDARESAGYARGRAEKQSNAPEQCRWFQDGTDSDTWQTGCGSYFMINDGTPSENNMAHCAYCGRHLVEYSWEEEQKGGK